MSGSKLIIVTIRLPVSLTRAGDEWIAEPRPAGLATALRIVAAQRPFIWIGGPGAVIAAEEREALTAQLERHQGIPVFIEAEENDRFYETSNRLLWPRFHNLSGPEHFDQDAWRAYEEVNEKFAAAIADVAEPGDTIWVHDYQLTLVPQLLRDRGLDCAIGFFLHIPFPSSESYRALPVREEILRGILGCDLIGFHTYEYVSHFRSACLRVLGLESEPETIVLPTHNAHLGVHPIGIDPGHFRALAAESEVEARYQQLREKHRGQQVVLGVDRLDYTKGLPQKLLAYEELLREHPHLHGQVVLIQVASPSRMDVVEYRSLKRDIDELSGRINGTYGTLEWTPLVYINQRLDRKELTALYRLADVALVTPVRDGMNLVALEYVAARRDDPGTLILSEFAGAAACLPGARLVNPHNPTDMARVLADALAMPPNEDAFAHMKEFVDTNTSLAWGQGFIERLETAYSDLHEAVTQLRVDRGVAGGLVSGAREPLLLLGYDGTLSPAADTDADAAPSDQLRTLLVELSEVATVYILSGRPAEALDRWLGDLPIGLVCEHGLATKPPGGVWDEVERIDTAALRDIALPLFEDFKQRTPGSHIENKAASLAWHYRGADPKFGAYRSKELLALLETRLAGQPLSVLAEAGVIEVRHAHMTKGFAAQKLLAQHETADLIFAAGDDRTDEHMFEAVLRSGREPVLVCRVGGVNTVAPFVVRSPDELIEQLEVLVDRWHRERDL
jgi:trehalose 6-phosphate synthase/phosphatase